MRILIGHNSYQNPGGEDAVFKAECSLLTDFGEEVAVYERSNSEIDNFTAAAKLRYFFTLGRSQKTYGEIKTLIRKFKPDIAHFHNIFFMITPSAYFACKDEGVPVVQSLHNFRLMCSNGLFYRNQMVFEECLQKTLRRGVYHGCFKGSRLMTAAVAGMLQKHWNEKTWLNMVDAYVVATEFTKKKYIQGGIPGDKIFVKPNFVYPDNGIKGAKGSYALYAGRMSDEKGIALLLQAWKSMPEFPLRAMGGGPLMGWLKKYIGDNNLKNVELLGFVNQKEYDENMRNAAFLVVPSQCYENFPRIIAEAFSYGLPVLASRLGSLEEVVQEGSTGALFNPGDVSDLADKLRWMAGQGDHLHAMGLAARREFETKYSAKKNSERLMDIYHKAISMHRKTAHAGNDGK